MTNHDQAPRLAITVTIAVLAPVPRGTPFGAFDAVGKTLKLVEGLKVETVESSCCGMAGAFGYRADTYETSIAMGELSLLPAVRKAAPATVIAADGFSCRHQIHDGTGRSARHVARILAAAMRASGAPMETRR